MTTGRSVPVRGPSPHRTAVTAVGALALYGLCPLGSPLQGAVYLLTTAAVVVAVLLAVRGWTGGRLPGALLVAALACWWASYLGYVLHVGLLGSPPPSPSWGDAAHLAGYALLTVGCLVLVRRRTGGRDVRAARDAATITLALALTVTGMLWGTAAAGALLDAGPLRAAVSLAYPVADLLLLLVLLRLMMVPGGRPVALLCLVLALACALVADLGYLALAAASAAGAPAGPLLRWAAVMAGVHLLAHFVLLAAVLSPDRLQLTRPVIARHDTPPGPVRRAAVLLAWVLPPSALALRAAVGHGRVLPGLVICWLALVVLVTWRVAELLARASMERTVAHYERRFRAAFDSALVGMALVERRTGTMLDVNAFLAELVGRPAGDLLGAPAWTLLQAGDAGALREALPRLRAAPGGSWVMPGDQLLATSSGHRTWGVVALAALGEAGDRPGGHQGLLVLQVQDVTEHRQAQQSLVHHTTHDWLTGLPNRVLALDRAGHAVAARAGQGVAAVVADVDGLAVVNDTLGHQAGDQLLRAVGRRLSESIRPADTVARLGGGEFILLLEDVSGPEEAMQTAGRVLDRVREPLTVDGVEVQVTLSCGVALADAQADGQGLVHDAGLAMTAAKQAGGARVERYVPQLRRGFRERVAVEQWLRQGMDGRAFALALQPLVELATGRVLGHEALIRGRAAGGEVVPPSQFLRVAEETGLIVPIGDWVLRHALMTLPPVPAGGPGPAGRPGRPIRVAVNVSARQLLEPSFADDVLSALQDTGTRPDQLGLEISEDVLHSCLDVAAGALRQLQELGVEIALDDFGTGSSSLAHLRRIPVDVLKIDRSFVSGLGQGATDARIVEATVGLAHGLGIVIVAEGVETAQQRRLLADLGCEVGQGFLLGRPELVAGPLKQAPEAGR